MQLASIDQSAKLYYTMVYNTSSNDVILTGWDLNNLNRQLPHITLPFLSP